MNDLANYIDCKKLYVITSKLPDTLVELNLVSTIQHFSQM